MNIHLEKGRIVIEAPALDCNLLVRGALQAHYGLGVPEGPEDFTERLRKANAAQAACSILRRFITSDASTGHTDAKRQAAAVAGFLAGLRGEHRRLYPKDSGVANAVQAPECGKHPEREFRGGWEAGSAVWAACKMAETGEDPRADW